MWNNEYYGGPVYQALKKNDTISPPAESRGVIEMPNNLENDLMNVQQLNTLLTGYFDLPRVEL